MTQAKLLSDVKPLTAAGRGSQDVRQSPPAGCCQCGYYGPAPPRCRSHHKTAGAVTAEAADGDAEQTDQRHGASAADEDIPIAGYGRAAEQGAAEQAWGAGHSAR